jgi:hypothetical protein
MSTPFDEASVDLCQEFNLPIIKVASSDINDWPLIERIAKTKKPVILSNGGSSLKDQDDVVAFFMNRDIPIALNHCVSLYPSEDSELELNQIDFLKNRYPEIVIGQSTHEYHDWTNSMLIAYAKGARTFERHIDTPMEGYDMQIYNSTSEQIDIWFKAYHKVIEMCGGSPDQKRRNSEREIKYLDALVRGIYAKKEKLISPYNSRIYKSTITESILLEENQKFKRFYKKKEDNGLNIKEIEMIGEGKYFINGNWILLKTLQISTIEYSNREISVPIKSSKSDISLLYYYNYKKKYIIPMVSDVGFKIENFGVKDFINIPYKEDDSIFEKSLKIYSEKDFYSDVYYLVINGLKK